MKPALWKLSERPCGGTRLEGVKEVRVRGWISPWPEPQDSRMALNPRMELTSHVVLPCFGFYRGRILSPHSCDLEIEQCLWSTAGLSPG